MKNYKLSDDIACFSDQSWPSWPLTAGTYHHWLNSAMQDAPLGELVHGLRNVRGASVVRYVHLLLSFERFVEGCRMMKANLILHG